jgi:hypothetical protein
MEKKSAKGYKTFATPRGTKLNPSVKWTAELRNEVKSSSRYFTSRGPLFEVLYIFDAFTSVKRIRGAMFRPKLYINGLS